MTMYYPPPPHVVNVVKEVGVKHEEVSVQYFRQPHQQGGVHRTALKQVVYIAAGARNLCREPCHGVLLSRKFAADQLTYMDGNDICQLVAILICLHNISIVRYVPEGISPLKTLQTGCNRYLCFTPSGNGPEREKEPFHYFQMSFARHAELQLQCNSPADIIEKCYRICIAKLIQKCSRYNLRSVIFYFTPVQRMIRLFHSNLSGLFPDARPPRFCL